MMFWGIAFHAAASPVHVPDPERCAVYADMALEQFRRRREPEEPEEDNAVSQSGQEPL